MEAANMFSIMLYCCCRRRRRRRGLLLLLLLLVLFCFYCRPYCCSCQFCGCYCSFFFLYGCFVCHCKQSSANGFAIPRGSVGFHPKTVFGTMVTKDYNMVTMLPFLINWPRGSGSQTGALTSLGSGESLRPGARGFDV